MIKVTFPRDSASEVQAHISGYLESPKVFTIVKVGELFGEFKSLRLTDVVYALDEGMSIKLWWDEGRCASPLLPLSGRGRIDLSPFGGVHNPRNEGWTGHVVLSTHHHTPGEKMFFLGLEFAKVNS